MAIRPNIDCRVFRLSGDYDDYGNALYDEGTDAKCKIVRLKLESEKTSVRTDSSGSRGHARENVSNTSRLLFDEMTKLQNGDRIEILDFLLRVQATHRRYTTYGKFDHLEVDCDLWQ